MADWLLSRFHSERGYTFPIEPVEPFHGPTDWVARVRELAVDLPALTGLPLLPRPAEEGQQLSTSSTLGKSEAEAGVEILINASIAAGKWIPVTGEIYSVVEERLIPRKRQVNVQESVAFYLMVLILQGYVKTDGDKLTITSELAVKVLREDRCKWDPPSWGWHPE